MATATPPIYTATTPTTTAVPVPKGRLMTLEEWVEMARATMPEVTEDQRRSVQRRRLAYARQEVTPESDRTQARAA